ncbi:dTDP-4-dehydrorhamnose 3,5-epimerase [Cyclobacterium amurskyense]|uniref:dTDP-4-dehydrorhamnose 3,5-epimerase n=1 Tax=Cyclobacterium amurskyense TaxID=320787 RepID=A0A0H4P9F6_9BACT|nr:dTDP-4-dehydrorhamnose 3,5-epimerase [Cyclobacterium amurskyense]AKP50794.1 dTDP-4-dehydrorhamnose 3,5-epimerase [Cyclobacterium amurskyense]|tara:strand:- start:1053 stop:1604 length:552 start_codon:yes stop_codon:yes gene_type:complete
MEIRETPIKDVYEIYPKVFKDARGYFLESYRQDKFESKGLNTNWVQDNQSYSEAGIVRGLHFQTGAHAQAKLVRVISGKVLDVCVDLRKGSATYGKFHSVVLDEKLQNMLYVPTGFAHGFAVLEAAVFTYKCSNLYNKESEGGIIWNDKQLNIDWGVDEPLLSDKDQLWPDIEKFTEISKGGL